MGDLVIQYLNDGAATATDEIETLLRPAEIRRRA